MGLNPGFESILVILDVCSSLSCSKQCKVLLDFVHPEKQRLVVPHCPDNAVLAAERLASSSVDADERADVVYQEPQQVVLLGFSTQ